MRKDKGYQKDLHHYSYRARRPANSYASGENKSLEQFLADIDKRFEERIANAKKSYARIAAKTTLTGKTLRNYCRDCMLLEVRFDDECNLIPLEDVLAEIERERERYKDKQSYKYVRRTVNKDNQKFVYNSSREFHVVFGKPVVQRFLTFLLYLSTLPSEHSLNLALCLCRGHEIDP